MCLNMWKIQIFFFFCCAGADAVLPAAEGGPTWTQRGALRGQPAAQPLTQAVRDNPTRLSGR